MTTNAEIILCLRYVIHIRIHISHNTRPQTHELANSLRLTNPPTHLPTSARTTFHSHSKRIITGIKRKKTRHFVQPNTKTRCTACTDRAKTAKTNNAPLSERRPQYCICQMKPMLHILSFTSALFLSKRNLGFSCLAAAF